MKGVGRIRRPETENRQSQSFIKKKQDDDDDEEEEVMWKMIGKTRRR